MRYYRKFGIEFEFSSDIDELHDIIKIVIPSVYGPDSFKVYRKMKDSHNNRKWHLKQDPSTGCELATPVSTIKDLKKIQSVLTKLSKYDIEITNRDSVHIHICIEDVNPHNMIAAWLQIEPVILHCYPKSRQRNRYYCERLADKKPAYGRIANFFKDAEEIAKDHHASMSLYHYNSRKTVEFRLGEGTIDKSIVENFVKLYMLFCNYASNIDPIEVVCSKDLICESPRDLLYLLKIPYTGLKNFVTERYRQNI